MNKKEEMNTQEVKQETKPEIKSEENVMGPEDARRAQWKNGVGGIVILIVFIVIGVLAAGEESSNKNIPSSPSLPKPVSLGTEHVNNEAIWLHRSENHLQEAQKDIGTLKDQLNKLTQEKTSNEALTKAKDEKIQALENELKTFQAQLNAQKEAIQRTLPLEAQGRVDNADVQTNGAESASRSIEGIQQDEIALAQKEGASSADKMPSTYVPAGTFAKAILLSGLDASAGVTSQTQPRPVILRVLDEGTLPNHHHSHLKDCVVTGAGFGDISSERVYIRLERMSCVRPNKNIVDIPVYGYVSGPDGKAGIRGTAVWRENALLQRSFISGLFAGLGQQVSQSATPTALASSGAAQGVMEGSLLVKAGMANGASTALGKLADYNIKRAEQYQPIIQVSSTKVNVIFHTGFYFNEKKAQEGEINPASSSSSSMNTIASTQ